MNFRVFALLSVLSIGCSSPSSTLIEKEVYGEHIPLELDKNYVVPETDASVYSEFDKCNQPDILYLETADSGVKEYKLPTWCSGQRYIYKGDPSPETNDVGNSLLGGRDISPFR